MKQRSAIAVDFGASKIRVALVSPKGKITKQTSEETDKNGKNGTAITIQIAGLIKEVMSGADPKDMAGIGIASIGPLHYQRGGPVSSPNIPYSFVPLVKPLEKKFRTSVSLLNDANAAVLAEKHFGAGKNLENLVYITLSTGIGGGAIVNGDLLLGKSGNAAEVGHIVIDTKYDILCSCGKGKGHWEGMSSGSNIPRFFEVWAKKNNKRTLHYKTVKDIFVAARRNNKIALKFIDELAKVNAHAISSVIVAYDPQLITLGGSVTLKNKDFIVSGIKKYVDHYLTLPRIQATSLGDSIGILGAAAAVFKKNRGG
jgi:glucokinase